VAIPTNIEPVSCLGADATCCFFTTVVLVVGAFITFGVCGFD
jgi:hypothetical protein